MIMEYYGFFCCLWVFRFLKEGVWIEFFLVCKRKCEEEDFEICFVNEGICVK